VRFSRGHATATCKVYPEKLMAAPPPNVGRPFLLRRLDHTENDQHCRGKKAAEYRGVYDPLRYGHFLISGPLGGVQHAYLDRRYQ
jgi:hypothetical protein